MKATEGFRAGQWHEQTSILKGHSIYNLEKKKNFFFGGSGHMCGGQKLMQSSNGSGDREEREDNGIIPHSDNYDTCS